MKNKFFIRLVVFVICVVVIIINCFHNKVEINGYTPKQIKRTYGLDKIDFYGDNQTIGIIVAYGSDTISNDLSIFSEKFNLEQANLQIAYPQGNIYKITSDDISWIKETTMDVEWAHALAPKAKILLVIAKSSKKEDLLNAIEYANKNFADIISISWKFNEFRNETNYNKYFDNENIIYVASSGDNGPDVSWPSVHPNVLSVGGTTLSLNKDGDRIESETAWFNSGGGISQYIAKPSYQNEFADKNIHYRSIPDVAFLGDMSKGVSIYCSNKLIKDAGWSSLCGTSLGAPCWSAFIAICNEASGTNIKNIHQKLYDIAQNDTKHTNFYDVVEGDNGEFFANYGYDYVSGLGTPHYDMLLKKLLENTN